MVVVDGDVPVPEQERDAGPREERSLQQWMSGQSFSYLSKCLRGKPQWTRVENQPE